MSIRRLTLLALASLCALTGGLFVSAPALARISHDYLSQLTGVGDPVAVAVGSGSEVYVVDTENDVVDRFGSSGAPLAFSASEPYVNGAKLIGTPTGPGGAVVPFALFDGVAVDDSTGDVYIDSGQGVGQGVYVFSSSGEYLRQEIKGSPSTAVAVDQSTHDLYVVDQIGGVYGVEVLSSSGAHISRFGEGMLNNDTFGVAVDDTTEDAYVADYSEVFVFSPLGSFLPPAWTGKGTPAGPFFSYLLGIAVDQSSGHVYVADTKDNNATGRVEGTDPGVVDEFNSSTTEEYVTQLTGTPSGVFGGPQAVAVDPVNGDVYVANASGVVDVFGPDVLVPDVSTGEATSLETEGSATLDGTVDPDGVLVTSCEFEYGTEASYGKTAACEPAPGSGTEPVAVHANLAGLTPGTLYHYRLAAGNAGGSEYGEDHTFVAPARPRVEEESVSNVASASATLQVQVSLGGAETTYRFEYGPTSSYGESLPVPEGVAGSGIGAVELSVHPQDLKPSTTYHFRVVVGNEVQREVAGPDQQFTTQPAGTELVLPDGREWELVSPPDKYGADIEPLGFVEGATIQAAQGGGAIAYATNGPIVSDPPGNRAPEDTEVLSRRGPEGWESQDIATPNNEGDLRVGEEDEYSFFSLDLSLAVVSRSSRETLPPLPEGSQLTPYLRNDVSGEYEPVLTAADTLPGSEYASSLRMIMGVAPDLTHLVLRAPSVLKSGAAEGGLYEWAGGELQLVSVLPESEGGAAVRGMLGGAQGIYEPGSSSRHAISDDGSRVVWTRENGEPLYLRDMVRGETVRISPGEAEFQAASSDGSRVFFTEGRELYVFEVTSSPGEALAGKLVDLAGSGSGVKHEILGASEDGSYVYFAAEGVIGDGAQHGAEQGAPNLYVEHYDGIAWTAPHFITILSGEDNHDFHANNLGKQPTRVSPDGRYLTFMSDRSLTGYDNRDARSGEPDEEVFLYDAEADAGAGRLVCASCDPTGARPVGVHDPETYPGLLADAAKIWQGHWFAANVPGWMNTSNSAGFYEPRNLSNDGRLFFNSSDALVPADVDGTQDVYEYEPAGIGSCKAPGYGGSASDVFSEAAGGCVALISAGISGEESAFLDASEEGRDVFFLTTARLAPQDYDNAYDVYDAHECTSESPCPAPSALTPPPCSTGDACKPAPTPQPTIFGAPPSETFSGAGNIPPAAAPVIASSSPTRAQRLAKVLRACRKKPKRKRAGCESHARRRYAAKRSKAGRGSSVRAGR